MSLQNQLQHKIDFKTKPLGALGRLEKLALQIGLVQQTLNPKLTCPHILVFAADHGIAREGVSAYPAEVTFQMVSNIIQGGAAVSVFARQNGIALQTIDAGVNCDFESIPGLIDAKIAKGTQSFLTSDAMTAEQLQQCWDKAQTLVDAVAQSGCNVIGFGEMGIGNTSPAAMIMHYVCGFPLADCVGRGTGLNDAQLEHKYQVLQQARDFHGDLNDPKLILQKVGGFEIAQICGAMLAAFGHNMLVLVDGFIATSAYLLAREINPAIAQNAIFCHQSNESGHIKMLDYLQADAIVKMDMRVGEGTGCALAYPIIQNAVHFLNEMSSFESAGVSNKPE